MNTINTQSEKNSATFTFSPARAIHIMMLTLMVSAVAWSIAQLVGYVVAIPISIALTYVFGFLAEKVTAPFGSIGWIERALSAIALVALIGLTCGLSYGSIYAKLFAETSAIRHFESGRASTQRSIEHLIANAQTLENALQAWSIHSKEKQTQENEKGGSCPAKTASTPATGAIYAFRESEASTAKQLHQEISSKLADIKQRLNNAKGNKASDFAGVTTLSAELNAAVERGDALVRGSYVELTRSALLDQLKLEIDWPREKFKCGDATRDYLIQRGVSALNQMAKTPQLSPLISVIDLDNRQDVASRALIRSFNTVLRVMSLGAAGQFKDDPLMVGALEIGILNQETIPMLLSVLLEITVLLTSAAAARSGGQAMPTNPGGLLVTLDTAIAVSPRAWRRGLLQIVAILVGGMVRLFYVTPHRKGLAHVPEATFDDDPTFPSREMDWAVALLPYWFPIQISDYLVIPNGRADRVLTVARALTFQGFAAQLATACPFGNLTAQMGNRLQHLVADARGRSYAVFRLEPRFAQAMRIRALT